MHPQRVILGFVRRARRRACAGAGLAAAALALALALAAWWLVARIAPAHAFAAAVAGAVLAAALVLFELWRARLSVAAIDALAGTGDALVTYWPHRERRNSGMAEWLEAWLAARLQQQPAAVSARRRASRTLRRLLPLLPLLLLLLLLRLLLPAGFGQGDRLGLGGAPSPGQDASASGGGAGAPGEPRKDEADPDPAAPAGLPPKEPKPDDPGAAGEEVASRPVELPVREEFVVPSFVGEGPSRTAKAREAEQDVVPAPSAAASGGGASGQEPPPVATPEFARAAERANAARHVPPPERPIVQRYFKALAERR